MAPLDSEGGKVAASGSYSIAVAGLASAIAWPQREQNAGASAENSKTWWQAGHSTCIVNVLSETQALKDAPLIGPRDDFQLRKHGWPFFDAVVIVTAPARILLKLRVREYRYEFASLPLGCQVLWPSSSSSTA